MSCESGESDLESGGTLGTTTRDFFVVYGSRKYQLVLTGLWAHNNACKWEICPLGKKYNMHATQNILFLQK